MKAKKIVIKKYANRRLYDTSGSRYINLEDIAALVRNGKDLQVVDAKTGEDLTRVTLTQIIVEDAKGQPTGLPLELLRQLIVASDRVGQEFIMWYLKSAFDAYQNVQSSVQSRLSEVQSAALSPLQMVKNLVKRTVARKSGEGRPRICRSCVQRISELEGRIAETEAARSEAPTKPRRSRLMVSKRIVAARRDLTTHSSRPTIHNRPEVMSQTANIVQLKPRTLAGFREPTFATPKRRWSPRCAASGHSCGLTPAPNVRQQISQGEAIVAEFWSGQGPSKFRMASFTTGSAQSSFPTRRWNRPWRWSRTTTTTRTCTSPMCWTRS